MSISIIALIIGFLLLSGLIILGVEERMDAISITATMPFIVPPVVFVLMTKVSINPTILIGCVLIYAIVGFAFAIMKWFLFVLNVKKKLISYCSKRPGAGLGEWFSQPSSEFVRSLKIGRSSDFNLPPQINQNKAMFVRWIVWWPQMLIWTLMSGPLIFLLSFVIDETAFLLQSISHKVFADIKPKDD